LDLRGRGLRWNQVDTFSFFIFLNFGKFYVNYLALNEKEPDEGLGIVVPAGLGYGIED
jgi:hypothetical protein